MIDIAADVAKVRAWEATAKTGELPPIDVHAAALRIKNHLAAQGAGPPRERAVDKFMRTIRQDSPPVMPSWQAPAGNQSQPVERAADRYRRQRLAQDEKGKANG